MPRSPPHPDGKEDPTEYQDFHAALREHYQPLDFLEEPWVEKIAVWSWRLRRLVRCESGQIVRALAEHSHEIKQSSDRDSIELELAELKPGNRRDHRSSLPAAERGIGQAVAL